MELAIPVDGGEIWAEDTGDGRTLVLMHPGWGDAAGCPLIVVPGADHLLPLRTPGALAGIIGAHAP